MEYPVHIATVIKSIQIQSKPVESNGNIIIIGRFSALVVFNGITSEIMED